MGGGGEDALPGIAASYSPCKHHIPHLDMMSDRHILKSRGKIANGMHATAHERESSANKNIKAGWVALVLHSVAVSYLKQRVKEPPPHTRISRLDGSC